MTRYDKLSVYERILNVKNDQQQDRLFDELGGFNAVRKNWSLIRRPSQTPPADNLWRTWILSGGRSSGKTRTGAEWVKEKAEAYPSIRLLIVARTNLDIRESIVEGQSGILSLYGQNDPNRPEYRPSIRRLIWPNGSQAFITSADEPDSLRGLQAHYVWGDEFASWRTRGRDGLSVQDQLAVVARLGDAPQILLTTTPRKTRKLKELHRQMKNDPVRYRLSVMSTFDNALALSSPYIDGISNIYAGTQLAKTELKGKWPWKL